MHDAERDELLTQLADHRRTLAVYLRQLASLGADYAPPGVYNGSADARAAIARLKVSLRAAGVEVDDRPGDVAGPELPGQSARPAQPAQVIDGAAQVGLAVAGNIYGAVTINPAQVATSPGLAEALALLERMPTDENLALPAVMPLPTPHRMELARNPMFVGRDANLRMLARTLKGAQSVTAIGQIAASTGMGGIGKTNLATEFVHRYGRYFAGGVFWLSFADPAIIPTEIAACGLSGLIGQPGWHELPLGEQVALVRRAWEEPIPRLLVFDNCEDEQLVRQWRPATGGCRVLITSRRERWSTALGIVAQALDILPRAESMALLHKHRRDIAPGSLVLDAIADELGDLPLALHLAGSFLEAYSDDRVFGDPARFLSELRSQPILEHAALQGIDTTFSPTNHRLHVGRTFSLSYERLDPADPIDAGARELLACAVCLAPGEPIPRDLLIATVVGDQDDQALRRAAVRSIERARAVGLLENVGGHAFKIHRLVRWFIERIGDLHAAQAATEQTILQQSSQLQANPDITHMLAYQPHLRWVVDVALEAGRANAPYLCNEVGLCLNAIGAFAVAQGYFEQALAIFERQEPDNSNERATTLHNLAGVLWDQGNYPQARAYLEQVLRLDEARYGPVHPSTGDSLNALAVVILAQGDYAAARPLLERALAICERALGPDHRDTAIPLSNLAQLLSELGDYAAARPLQERALAICERVLGPDHRNTGTILNNLGLLLYELGDYAAARPLLERALAICERTLGPDHRDTAMAMNNLALLLYQIGDYAAARPLWERALAILERALSPDHPDTAMILLSLAQLLSLVGDYAVARPLFERALAILERALGPDHPGMAKGLNNLGQLLSQVGDYAAARPLLERAITIYEHTLGPDHRDTAMVLNNLALLLLQVGDYAAARPLLERALAIWEHALGPNHPDMATTLNNLGGLLRDQSDLAGARRYFARALAICERSLSDEHPTTRAVRRNLANLDDAPLQTPAQQIAEIEAEAAAAVATALADASSDRAGLAQQLEARARWAEDGEHEGSPYLALAARLRVLAAQLVL